MLVPARKDSDLNVLPPPVRLLFAHIGSVTPVGSGEGGSQSWRVTCAPRVFYVRVHRSVRKFAQELAAAHAANAHAPGLVAPVAATFPDVLALVYDAVPGVQLTDNTVLDGETLRAAGRALRRFHCVPAHVDDPMPIGHAVTRRLNAAAAGTDLGPATVDAICNWARARVEAARVPRVLCHRDFAARNWVLRPDGEIALIDLEHARPDVWVNDLRAFCSNDPNRLETSRLEALLEGYGAPLTSAHLDLLSAFVLLDAVGELAWGLRHADSNREADARRRIAAAGFDSRPARAAI